MHDQLQLPAPPDGLVIRWDHESAEVQLPVHLPRDHGENSMAILLIALLGGVPSAVLVAALLPILGFWALPFVVVGVTGLVLGLWLSLAEQVTVSLDTRRLTLTATRRGWAAGSTTTTVVLSEIREVRLLDEGPTLVIEIVRRGLHPLLLGGRLAPAQTRWLHALLAAAVDAHRQGEARPEPVPEALRALLDPEGP